MRTLLIGFPPLARPSVAYLCEVSRLEPPQESNRHPTWFSAEKAKQRLLKGRTHEFGSELACVVDRAAARVRRTHENSGSMPVRPRKDALQDVRFEAFELARLHGVAWSASRSVLYSRYIRRERPGGGTPLALSPATLRLQSGNPSSPDALQKVQFIDESRSAHRAKSVGNSTRNRRK